eukprot:evm.model.NODE_5351_length_3213_cov_36.279491.2
MLVEELCRVGTRQKVTELMRAPHLIANLRLRREVTQCIELDEDFSPGADRVARSIDAGRPVAGSSGPCRRRGEATRRELDRQHIHNIRARDSYIRGSNGTSNGIVPMLRVFNDTARYVDQGGGKRKGSFAIYLEPWHADIFEFLDLRKNHGNELERARDLFYALWTPDLFMQRVENDGDWSLFCPNECPGLADVCGEEFKQLYETYEKSGKARKVIKAQQLWFAVLDSQVETGTPYMLFKDACNLKSNQQNLGVIKSSNLCTEIIEYTAPDEVAVCNLASVNLSAFVREEPTGSGKAPSYDLQRLAWRMRSSKCASPSSRQTRTS